MGENIVGLAFIEVKHLVPLPIIFLFILESRLVSFDSVQDSFLQSISICMCVYRIAVMAVI